MTDLDAFAAALAARLDGDDQLDAEIDAELDAVDLLVPGFSARVGVRVECGEDVLDAMLAELDAELSSHGLTLHDVET